MMYKEKVSNWKYKIVQNKKMGDKKKYWAMGCSSNA